MTQRIPREGRGLLDARPLTVERGVSRHAEGSAQLRIGNTEVLATVSIDHKVPPHQRGKKEGWLMAEYSMLPRSTQDRIARERNLQNGRRHEIQRLLGRSFRTALDLKPFRNQTLVIDCDVLEADGGTRVASVLAGYAALYDLSERLVQTGVLIHSPILYPVGAVSVGLVDGEIRMDLDYSEDAGASADLNVVATLDGRLLEAQGGAEGTPMDPDVYIQLLRAGIVGAGQLLAEVQRQL
ncbi:ribonuclease PH [Deinococcus aquiradiocola]|uniref:Ribonuclease PH n=1 Tax=Deinococcus aquiradiocola TaxID=393059 RepID=A0A917P477_9DEIO|nr:ribonuclease PH [Deinococcus aquiradiocola]GGJ60855.1 ribonuclease PH [Deinococcus aquiradiocola]